MDGLWKRCAACTWVSELKARNLLRVEVSDWWLKLDKYLINLLDSGIFTFVTLVFCSIMDNTELFYPFMETYHPMMYLLEMQSHLSNH